MSSRPGARDPLCAGWLEPPAFRIIRWGNLRRGVIGCDFKIFLYKSAFMELRGLTGEAKAQFLQRLDAGIVYVSETRLMALCRAAGLSLLCRYFGGFLYSGWLFIREAGATDSERLRPR